MNFSSSKKKINQLARLLVVINRLKCSWNSRRELLYPDSGGSKLLWNVSNYLQINVALYPRRLDSWNMHDLYVALYNSFAILKYRVCQLHTSLLLLLQSEWMLHVFLFCHTRVIKVCRKVLILLSSEYEEIKLQFRGLWVIIIWPLLYVFAFSGNFWLL